MEPAELTAVLIELALLAAGALVLALRDGAAARVAASAVATAALGDLALVVAGAAGWPAWLRIAAPVALSAALLVVVQARRLVVLRRWERFERAFRAHVDALGASGEPQR